MSEEASLDEFAKAQSEDKIEFVETAAGRIPSDWDTKSVESLCKLRNGKATDHADEGVKQYPVYGSNGPIGSHSESNFDGGLIFGRVGAVGEVEKVYQPVWVSDNAIQAQPSGDINTNFLYYCLSNRELGALATKTAQPLLNQSTIGNVAVPYPSYKEQRKIATVLYTVDQAIQKTEEIEAQTRRTRKGIVQNILTHGLSESEVSDTGTVLGQLPEHWEVTTIAEIVADEDHAFTDGARYSLSSAEIHDEGDARAILLQEVGEGEFNDSEPKFATEEKYEEITHRAIYPGEAVVAKMAEPVARACIVPDTYDKYLLGCADVVRVLTDEEFNDRFLMYCMNSHKLWSQAVAHLRGTGRSRINLENISELNIPKPPLHEQVKIAEAIRQFDRRIENEQDYQNQLKRLKQGLMQDLLSGAVRTHEADIDCEAVLAHG